ncbi:MAG: DUF192 domain-containing protein [Bdellovibrionales bacterium]
MRLMNRDKNLALSEHVQLAQSFSTRLFGLMGKKDMRSVDETYLFQPCTSIHTCFMNFPIDVIFLDKQKVVKKIYWNMKPWRFTKIHWSCDAALEFKSGYLNKTMIEEGDALYVES